MFKIDLKNVLLKNGYTQADFSGKSGVSLATISKVCNNMSYKPSLLIENKIINTLRRLKFINEEN